MDESKRQPWLEVNPIHFSKKQNTTLYSKFPKFTESRTAPRIFHDGCPICNLPFKLFPGPILQRNRSRYRQFRTGRLALGTT